MEDAVVMVTGGGRGIGLAIGQRLARHGARIVVVDCGCDTSGEGADSSVATKAARELAQLGGAALACPLDVRAPNSFAAALELCRKRFGRLDALIFCAGVFAERSILRHDADGIDRVIDVQLRAACQWSRQAASYWVEQQIPGAIVLMSAPEAFFGAPRQAPLAAAHAGVAAFARSAALDLQRHRIRINAIAPRALTRQTAHLPALQGVSAARLQPDYVAAAAEFLISPHAAKITGQLVGVAGNRLYALRTVETAGAFVAGDDVSVAELHELWPAASH